ncbi:MAG TPA: aconitase family protein, partial [Candidatus Bilamarchaeaceae archaeon]|nr:aconitase family protein [Candidatus Bilamarchaeaceae archaeon]
MGLPLAKKILQSHLAEGKMEPGEEIGIKVDQVLTQDATGTMAFLQFEAIGLDRIKVPLAVSYVDHNMLQTDFMNPDDHKYLETVAAKYGAYFSKPGNGICHQVHLERFSQPGKILIGSDSHTPTSGGAGMLAIGVGGLSIATVMGGEPCYVAMPEIVGVKLTGRLKPWVTAKDIILEMLRRLTVKGGLNRIIEYYGEGVETLSVPQRSTITNMGAEMGATTSIFPSDEVTKSYFQWQQREKDWQPAQTDTDAVYDKNMEINLSELEPMIVKPGSPDNVVPVKEVEGTETQQVIIGSCTNSSYTDLMAAVSILKGRKIHSRVTFGVNPGSRQVLMNVARAGALEVFTL